MKIMLTIPALILAAFGNTAMADENGNAVAGALIGGAAGAAIGHHFSGRNGAVVGGALGAATGVAVATSKQRSDPPPARYSDSDRDRDAYIYRDDDEDAGDSYDRERVVYREPVREQVIYQEPVREQVVVYRPAPVVVYRPAPVVVYRPERRAVRYEVVGWDRHDNGWHRGWDKHRHHDRHWDRDDD